MRIRFYVFILFSLSMAQICRADSSQVDQQREQHAEITMRMLGHQVLLATGDSLSLVKPVEKIDNTYRIRFEAEFGFHPDSIASVIDSIMEATQISENYVVEFVSCDSQKVAYGYEVNEEADVLACRGRPYPKACYELVITLLDVESNQAGSDAFLIIALLIGLVLILASMFVFLRRKSTSQEESHLIKLGRFLFDRRNMELTLKAERIDLTSKESDLLYLLYASVNETVERDDILRSVWGDDGDYVGRTLDVFISKLRKKLEADANIKIINIRGIGYKLVLNEN